MEPKANKELLKEEGFVLLEVGVASGGAAGGDSEVTCDVKEVNVSIIVELPDYNY